MAIDYAVRVAGRESSERQIAGTIGIANFCTPKQFERLERIMVPMRVAAGGCLFWEGDETENVYYIRSGRVKLRKSTEDGKEYILSILQAGDMIFETAGGQESKHYGYTAEVADNAEFGVIARSDMDALMQQDTGLAIGLLNLTSYHHRITQSKFRDLLLFGKPGALASTLIRLSNSFGVQETYGTRIRPSPTR